MAFPSLPEKIFLLLIICASLAGFMRRFLPVVRIIQAAKPDPDFSLEALIPRLRTFIWEVLFQGKIIRYRPVAGAAHAFVFWGFIAFALVTINPLATGFGFPLLPRQNPAVRAYFAFVALWAVLVAVSISWLAFRRYSPRPMWLGPIE